MATYSIGKKVSGQLKKIELNEFGDYILINPGDATFLKKFNALIEWMDNKSIELSSIAAEMGEKYKGKPMISMDEDGKANVDTEQLTVFTDIKNNLYEGCIAKIDELFGQDTMKKYFRVLYEANQDFIPDEDCIMDFLEEITPVLEEIYKERSEQINRKYNKNRKNGNKRK